MITIREMLKEDTQQWDDFVRSVSSASFPHLYNWKYVFEKTYALKTNYLGAFEKDNLISVFPSATIKYPLQKNKLISLPYLNNAGPLFLNEFDGASIIDSYNKYLLTRGLTNVEMRIPFPYSQNVFTDEFSMVLRLGSNEEMLWKNLDVKVRNQIRKALKSNLTVSWGINQLKEFYDIYSINISKLGTPIHSFLFFSNIANYFPELADILIVRLNKRPIASMFLFKFKSVISDPWASSLNEFIKLCPNMLMYWEAIKFGGTNGFDRFDFGRSNLNSGTYNFKKQWNTEAIPIYNISFVNGSLEDKSSVQNYRGRKAKLFSSIWKKIPNALAKKAGPAIRKYIP